MKDKGISILFITILLFIVLPAKRLNAQNQDISDSGWPKLFIDGKDSILMYQPQVDSWKDNDLIFRSAIGYIAALSNEQKYGVITFSVQTEVDKPNNLVYLSELQISNLNFPTISDNGKKISYLVLNNLKDDNTISLSRLQSDLSINDAINKQVVTVKNDPPEIFCSYNPAVLVIIDGDPQTKQITSSSYSKVINTSAFILKNSQDGSYYLSLFGEWFYSLKISGPWIIYNNAVKEIDALLSNFLTKDSTIQLFRPPSDDIKSYIAKGKQPKIFVANAPSELIIFDGQPQYVPISGTNLLYASNTKANVFKNTTDNLTYILISGRWYSAIDMKGQWSYVDPANLPSDFLKIPADNLKANVLVYRAKCPMNDISTSSNDRL